MKEFPSHTSTDGSLDLKAVVQCKVLGGENKK